MRTGTIFSRHYRLEHDLTAPRHAFSLEGIHLNRDKLSPITYSDQLHAITISATLQSADRRHDMVGPPCADCQRDSCTREGEQPTAC